MNELSEKSYWNEIHWKMTFPRIVKDKQYPAWVIDSFIEPFIKGKTLFEMGCGSSAWLPFLAKKYNLLVSGLDYTHIGAFNCKRNLTIQNIKFDEIIEQDVLTWDTDKKYDIIISFGLIEHFEKPETVLFNAYKHLNDGGLIITVIPNLMGLAHQLTHRFIPESSDGYKKINKRILSGLHNSAGFNLLNCGYAGMIYPLLIPWSVRFKRLAFVNLLNAIITKLFRALKFNPSSEYFSAFIIYVGKK